MIRRWSNGIIIFALLTAAVAIMGYYIYASYKQTNDQMERLKTEGILVLADAGKLKLDSVTYDDVNAHVWGYVIPGVEHQSASSFDGVTMSSYTNAQMEEAGGKVEVYYMYDDETLVTFDKVYVENFTPWKYSQSNLLWVIGGVTFAVVLYYVARNVIALVVLKKGEPGIAMFVEAFHAKTGSKKYYKVKYSFVRDGENVTYVSPAIYNSQQVEKLKTYSSFKIRYLGKISFIDERV